MHQNILSVTTQFIKCLIDANVYCNNSCRLLLQLIDYRVEFSKWWSTEFKTIKFPSAGTVFDYCIDPRTHKFIPWQEKVPRFEFDEEMPLQVHNFY